MQTLKALEVFNGARALLNDQDIQLYTNATLMEYYKIAYEKLKQELGESNVPITNKTSNAITIISGMKDIGGPTGPALPNDLIEVIDCWEIPAGTNNDYMLMRRMRFLPKTVVLTSYLEVYSWAEQYIHFLGANGDIQVKLDYLSTGLSEPIDANSLVKVTYASNYLKITTAALAARFIGEDNERYSDLMPLSQDALDQLMSIKIQSAQGINTRRRPFMANWKLRGGLSGR